MSAESPAYSPTSIKVWTYVSIGAAVIFFGMFVLGDVILQAGKPAWDLIRWLASPLI